VVVPAHGRARDLDALLQRKVDAAVGDDDVAALAERRHDRRDAAEGVRVDDGGGDVEEGGDVTLELEVDVCRVLAVSL